MHELSPADYFLAAPLFASIPHHRVIVFSVLEGGCPGCVFVDDPAHPKTAFVSSITEFFFFGGDPANRDFTTAIKERVIPGLVRQMPALALSGPEPAWQPVIDEVLADYPGGGANRAEFDSPPQNSAQIAGWRRRLPPEWRVETYTREVARRFVEIEPFWNGLDNFLTRGFGFYVSRGDDLLSHCHTVAVGDGLAEISVETDPAHRRQGLARLAVSAFVEHSLRVGLQPHWTCWRDNQPSVALAESLGFVHRVDAPVRYVIPAG